MNEYGNPFVFKGARKLVTEMIVNVYQDHNYSRFIHSHSNVYLVGDRGSGKSMALRYYSLPIQLFKVGNDINKLDFSIICIYVPCKTVLTYRKDYELEEDFQASMISEHFLVASIIFEIAKTFEDANIEIEIDEEEEIHNEINYLLDIELPARNTIWKSIRSYMEKEMILAQKELNFKQTDMSNKTTLTFLSSVIPLLGRLKKIKKFSKSHFSLMLDDVHDLNLHQIAIVNSWIAFRDNSLFSFKVATAKTGRPSLKTAQGGSIIEGHDFTQVDMEGAYQNKHSDFGTWATKIITQRLEKAGLEKDPYVFLPMHPQFQKDMIKFNKQAKNDAIEKFGSKKKKAIADYVYKYEGVLYFRNRSSKSNVPSAAYSGFETLLHLSTGVIRNLLIPCYEMYDKVTLEGKQKSITHIPPGDQADVIIDRSYKKWNELKKLDESQKCSIDQARQITCLFENLAVLFKKRLLGHKSEPRAIKFLITEKGHPYYVELCQLLEIVKAQQLLYSYIGSAKEFARRAEYYVPNKILWPSMGLDLQGQHSVVSLKTSVLWDAATKNKEIPLYSA